MSNPAERTERYPWLAAVCFTLLVALLAVRALITENYERSTQYFLEGVPSGPTPLTTVLLDHLTLLAAGVGLALRGPRGDTRMLLGGVLLIAGLAVSFAFAGDKRLALNAGSTLVIVLLAGWALVSLRPPVAWVHMLIAVVLAVTVVDAVKCLSQWGYEFEMTREAWQERKAAMQSEGLDVSTPQLIDYERRLASAEAFGYQAHPNVAAAVLTLGCITALAAAWGSLSGSCGPSVPVLLGGLAAVLLGGVWTTGSLAGLATLGLGVVLLLVLPRLPGAALRGRLLLIGYPLLMLGLLALGWLRGGLPGASLDFRWQYWSGAAGVIGEAPWTGVGRLNFGPHYLTHKVAEATETVADPHNIWITLLAELGPIALLGALLLVGRVVQRLCQDTSVWNESEAEGGRLPIWLPLLAVPVLHAVFSATPLLAPGVGMLWAVEVVLAYAVVLVLVQSGLQHLQSGQARRALLYGVLVALVVNLVHNIIGFSLMTPGGLAVVVLLVAGGLQLAVPGRGAGGLSVPMLLGTGLMVALHLATVVLPTARSQQAFDRLQSAGQLERVQAAARDLAGVDPWDPRAPRTAAGQLVGLALHPRAPRALRQELLGEAAELARRSTTRNPRDASAHVMEARIAFAQAGASDGPTAARGYLDQAVTHWQAGLERNPTRARLYLEASRAAARRYALQAEDALLAQLRAWHARALGLDALRNAEETAKLRAEELAEFEQLLQLPVTGG